MGGLALFALAVAVWSNKEIAAAAVAACVLVPALVLLLPVRIYQFRAERAERAARTARAKAKEEEAKLKGKRKKKALAKGA